MDVFGSFTLLLAFVCAVYALVGGIAAVITRHPIAPSAASVAEAKHDTNPDGEEK